MNAVTQVERDLIEDVLDQFDAGRLDRYWPAANGIENSNYFVRTTRGEFVLTVLEQPPAAGDAYLSLLAELNAAGLPVPVPLVRNDGDQWATVAGKPALLQPKLPGEHIHNPAQQNLASIGRFTARMHRAVTNTVNTLPDYPRDLAWLKQTAAEVTPFLPYSKASLVNESVDRLTSLLSRQDVALLPTGAIHGDLFRDNALFQNGRLTGVLDFHHASKGTLLYDLAVIANDWCCDSVGRLNYERTMALIKSYHAVRPLGRLELWFFPMYALYASCAFWLSRIEANIRSAKDASVRVKNPEELQAIVAAHNAQVFYIDERLLDGFE